MTRRRRNPRVVRVRIQVPADLPEGSSAEQIAVRSAFSRRVPRLVLKVRCRDCGKRVALLLCPMTATTVEDITARAWWWRPEDVRKNHCSCGRELPPPDSLGRDIKRRVTRGLDLPEPVHVVL